MPSTTARVIDSALNCPDLPIVEGEGRAIAIVWPGSGADYRTMQKITLSGGASTVPLSHESDAAYYVVRGAGEILDLASAERHPLGEGSMIHIDAGDCYRFVAADGGCEVVGGPCPADLSLYAGLPSD